jgi:hypothetical protein
MSAGANVCDALVKVLNEAAGHDDRRHCVAGMIRRISQNETGRAALIQAGTDVALQKSIKLYKMDPRQTLERAMRDLRI